MKRLPLLGLILALASCEATIDSGGATDDQSVACYDTGSGMKCVPLDQLPSNTTAVCIDKDGVTDVSQSSAEGPSPSDNDTSQSSDSPDLMAGLPTGLTDDDDDDGDSDDSTDDDSGASNSTEENCATGTDTDADGVSDSQDCDCIDADTPTNVPPGGTPPGSPTGGGGPIIL